MFCGFFLRKSDNLEYRKSVVKKKFLDKNFKIRSEKVRGIRSLREYSLIERCLRLVHLIYWQLFEEERRMKNTRKNLFT